MPYLIVFLLALLFTYRYDIKKYAQRKETAYFILFLAAVLLAGCRYVVGGDTVRYMRYWDEYPKFGEGNIFYEARFDPLWTLLNVACKSICDDFVFFQFVHAILLNAILFYGVFKKQDFFKEKRFTVVLFYFVYYFLYFNMEVLRESLAVAVILLGFPYLNNHKWLNYYLFFTIAFLLHSSAIIAVFFPFLWNKRLTKIKVVACCLIAVAVFTFLGELLKYLPITEMLMFKYDLYVDAGMNANGKILRFVLYIFIPLMLIYINDNLLRRKSSVYSRFYMIFIFVASISIANTAFGGRFLNYVCMLMIGYYVYILYNISKSRYFEGIKKIVVLLLIVCPLGYNYRIYFENHSYILKGAKGSFCWYPYTNIFQRGAPEIEKLVSDREYYVDMLMFNQRK